MGNRLEQLLERPSPRELAVLTLAGMAGYWAIKKGIELRLVKRNSELDQMTGLLTAEAFQKKVIARTKISKRASDIGLIHGLVLCDLDWVKEWNDTHGHIPTDRKVITPAAHAIRDTVRTESGLDLVGRGGERSDEFPVFLSGVQSMKNALAVANLIHRNVTSILPFESEGDTRYIQVSIGCALLEQGGSYDDALRQADIALYAAKRAGRNQVIAYSDDMAM